MIKNGLILLFVFTLVTSHTQHRIGDFLAYGNNDGLPAALFYKVLQSSDGYLWIGSSSGLIRFDGKRYKIFFSDYADTTSISDNIIIDLVEDDDNNLWIPGFYQGLSKYNLRTGEIKRYSRLSNDSTPGYGINSLLKDNDGQIWIATAGRGLAHYLSSNDSFEFFIPDPLKPHDGSDRLSNHVSDIAPDQSDENILWLSCFDGLYSFNKKQKIFERFIFYHPEIKNTPMDFLCVETDQSSKIWLGTWYHGLMSFDKISHHFAVFPFAGADPTNSQHYQVLDIQSINDSTLYFASRNSGLLSFNKKSHDIHSLLTNNMLPGGSSGIDIQHISVTGDAGLFVGGNYYIYQQHPSFNRFGNSIYFSNFTDFNLQQVVYDSSRLGYWVGSLNAGAVIFYSNDIVDKKLFKEENQIVFQCTDIAVDRKQRVWAVSYFSGLLRLEEDQDLFRNVENDIPGIDTIAKTITLIENDSHGNLWLLTRKKLFYFDVEKNTLQGFDLLHNRDALLYELSLCSGKHDDVWIASDKGLFHCIRRKDKVIHLVPDEESRKGIANLLIKTMTIDKVGNAWLGFESDGVQVISFKDHSILSSYNLTDGLPGMQINFMATDSAGGIWAGTSAGLALFNPDSEAKVWQLFNREDGIRRDYIDRPIIATEDGKLFFNIERGFSWVDIADEKLLYENKPLLHLTSFIVDGKTYPKDLLPDFLSKVELPYYSREINIEFAAMDWLHPSRTKYFYRIEGISQPGEWIENNQARLTLTGMKPGKYTLRLYAVNSDGIKSDEKQLAMWIHSPFWQRWWFIGLCFLGAILIGYCIYRYRIGELQKLQAMRNTIS
ncbi:MAG TPA: two-component regulator propeller domain-containing protein, partial [Saprospiraceae bacterium]|nr:two-component regulator propeller domain-containing protein [Saprospiraceae bacterium]